MALRTSGWFIVADWPVPYPPTSGPGKVFPPKLRPIRPPLYDADTIKAAPAPKLFIMNPPERGKKVKKKEPVLGYWNVPEERWAVSREDAPHYQSREEAEAVAVVEAARHPWLIGKIRVELLLYRMSGRAEEP